MTFVKTTSSQRVKEPTFSVAFNSNGLPVVTVEVDNTRSTTLFVRAIHTVGSNRHVVGWFPPGSSRSVKIGPLRGGVLTIEGNSPRDIYGMLAVPREIGPLLAFPRVTLARVPAAVGNMSPIRTFSSVLMTVKNENQRPIEVEILKGEGAESLLLERTTIQPNEVRFISDPSAGVSGVRYTVRMGNLYQQYGVSGLVDTTSGNPVFTFVQRHLQTRVIVDSLSPEIISVSLFRSGRLVGEATPIAGSCEFVDKSSLTPGRLYRYQLVCNLREASSKTFGASYRRYPEANLLDLALDVQRTEPATFQVDLSVGDKGIQRIVRQVADTSPEYLSVFGEDIQSRRNTIASSLFYEVERVELGTSEVVSLGVFPASQTTFTDSGRNESTGPFRYVFTPIAQDPVAALEAQQTQRDVDGTGTKSVRIRRFFNPIVRSNYAMPSRIRVINDQQDIAEFLLATSDETQLSKLAAVVEVRESGSVTTPPVKLVSSGYEIAEQRIGSPTPDVVVKCLLTDVPPKGIRVRLRDEKSRVATYRFLVDSKEVSQRIPAPPIRPVEVEIEVV